MERGAEFSPRVIVRLAAAFYLLTFATGSYALIDRGRAGVAAGMVAGASYIAVTLLFYRIFKPVSAWLSLLAAAVSLFGIVAGPLRLTSLNPLVFFGVYCLLIGYLILKSTFLPRFLGVVLLVAGFGWLTFLSPALTASLSPYNLAPGIVGEGVLTLWLLLAGVDVPRWQAQARVGRVSTPDPG
jgi:hypothetical protein